MMAAEEPHYPTRLPVEEDDPPFNAFFSRNRCCFHFPCFGSPTADRLTGGATPSCASPPSLWDRLRASDADDRWWTRPLRALKRLRDWSEIVAGPKWKTFIRRFNHQRNPRHQVAGAGKFQYDPLSYALNFDEGPGQNGQYEDDYSYFPDFTSRFVAAPLSAKSSMDLSNAARAPAG